MGAVQFTVASQVVAALFCTILFGQVMVGGVVSTLFTTNEHVLVLPLPSLAVSVTVVAPTPVKVVLARGDWVIVGVLQLSLVVVAL